MNIADFRGLMALVLLLCANLVHAQDTAPETPATENRAVEVKPSEPASEPDSRAFTPSEEVSADAEVDFPADI